MGISTAPEPLGQRHDISQFNSGVSSIDTWLRSKAHLNEAGFWDVARTSDAPLVATHSNVHQLCASSRNLTDKQLAAIANKLAEDYEARLRQLIRIAEDALNRRDGAS